jgi:pimeloyl-ACP methyl ester carboxylesterase
MNQTSAENSGKTHIWTWKGFPICYHTQGDTGNAVILIHGFGASWGHWRKNIPVLAQNNRVFAIDLIGFGGSAKPAPEMINYTFETWGDLVADFCREVVQTQAFLVGNSIGCVVAMQAIIDHPELFLEVALINCSLRLLHDKKRAKMPFYKRYGAGLVQELLAVDWFGNFFFKQIAKKDVVKKILLQAYKKHDAVNDELIEILMKPAMDKGAKDVFIAFTRYSQGPLPEELLPKLPIPAIILWGTDDPWEDINLGQEWAKFTTVKKFIPLEGIGHCPQDEAPEIVNPILLQWLLGE